MMNILVESIPMRLNQPGLYGFSPKYCDSNSNKNDDSK